MKISRPPHNWNVSPKQAIRIQERMRHRVSFKKESSPFRFIAGVDAAYVPKKNICVAGVVLWDIVKKSVLEEHSACRKISFPYVPGLLTFREAPAVIAVLRRLKMNPDAIMCDGQGIAHPRRLGIASHIGILADIPSIGCAKSRLSGVFSEPGNTRGASSLLVDKGENIGMVLRTQNNVKPVFVSIGHKIDLKTSKKIILDCNGGYRLPEPTRLADQLVGRAKRRIAP